MNNLNKKVVEISNSIEKGIISKQAGAIQIMNEFKAILIKQTKFAKDDLQREIFMDSYMNEELGKEGLMEQEDEFDSEIENIDPQDDENYIYEAGVIDGYMRAIIDLNNNITKD